MAAINEQQEFALHSLNEENKNKTFVFVKLTDSALKSIEDYMSLNPNLRQGIAKPKIQFQNDSNQGAITLPLNNNNGASNGGKNEIRYSFNLSNVDADGPQGSFEFLRQRKMNKYEECIESLGSMFIKMQFHASDDIYQKTKVKMANAELDAKKHSTKVIKETGPNVGRKIKKTIISTGSNTLTNGSSSISKSSLSGNTEPQSSAYSSYVKDLLNVNSTFEPNHSPKSSSSKFLNSNSSTTTTNSKPTSTSTAKQSTDETCLNSINHSSSSQQQNSSTLNQSKSTNNSTATANLGNSNIAISTQTPNPELLRKPIRDRVIHLLALRPFKKPELHVKLNRDGLREKDKKGLGALLMQIANLKDNAYHLHRGAWHEVQVDDWPFYTSEERDLVRKRNPLLFSQSSTAVTSSHLNANSNDLNSAISSISPLANFDNQQQSPLMHHSASPSNKRTLDQSASASGAQNGQIVGSDYDYTTANKKQRISHHKANSEQQQSIIKKRSPPLSNSINTIIQNNASLIGNSTVNQANRSNGNSNTLSNSSSQNHKATSNKLTAKYDDVINIWENKPKTPDEQLQSNGHYSNSNTTNTNSHSSPELNSSVNSNSSNGLVSSTNKLISGNGQMDNNKTASKKNGLNNYRSSNGSANFSSATSSDRFHHANNISSYSNQPNYHHSNQFHHSSANNATTNSHFNSFTNHHHHYNNSNQQQHNSSLCSTPNSSPDSGTGSNDGSLASTSSLRSNSTNEDYLR